MKEIIFDKGGKLDGYYKEIKPNVFVFTNNVFPQIKEYNKRNGLPCDVFYDIKVENKVDFCTLFVPKKGITYWFYPIFCDDDFYYHIPMLAHQIQLLDGSLLQLQTSFYSFTEPYSHFCEIILSMFGYHVLRYRKSEFNKGNIPYLLIECSNKLLHYKKTLMAIIEEEELDNYPENTNILAYRNYKKQMEEDDRKKDEEFNRNPYRISYYLQKSNIILQYCSYSLHFFDTDHPVIVFNDKYKYLRVYNFREICKIVLSGNVCFEIEKVHIRHLIIPIAEYVYNYYSRKGIKLHKSEFKKLCQSFGSYTWDKHKTYDSKMLGITTFMTYLISTLSRFNLKTKA